MFKKLIFIVVLVSLLTWLSLSDSLLFFRATFTSLSAPCLSRAPGRFISASIYLHPILLHFITRHNFFSARVSLLSPSRWQATGDIALWWPVDFKCGVTGAAVKYCIIAVESSTVHMCVCVGGWSHTSVRTWEYVRSCWCAWLDILQLQWW